MKRELGFFAVAGIAGFAVDAGGVLLLHGLLGWGPLIARVPSFSAAVCVTFFLNRSLTFRATHLPLFRAFLTYVSAIGLAQGGSLAIYTALILSSDFFKTWPVFALAAGSLAAMAFSFSASKYLIFKPHENTKPE